MLSLSLAVSLFLVSSPFFPHLAAVWSPGGTGIRRKCKEDLTFLVELESEVAFIWCGIFQMLLLFLFACILVLANSESSVQVHYLLAPTFSHFGRWGSSNHPLGSQALQDRVKLSTKFS